MYRTGLREERDEVGCRGLRPSTPLRPLSKLRELKYV